MKFIYSELVIVESGGGGFIRDGVVVCDCTVSSAHYGRERRRIA